MAGPQGAGALIKPFANPIPTGGSAIGDDGYRKFHYFTVSGTFDPGAVTSVDLYALGAGGSAGDGIAGTRFDAGGAGGIVRESQDVAISGPQVVTVGLGGVYLNGSNNGTDGGNGGDTIIGSLLTATGGQGGGIPGVQTGGNNADFNGSGSVSGGSGAGAGAGSNGTSAAFNSTGGNGKMSFMTGDARGGGGAGGNNNTTANVGGPLGGGGYNVAGVDQYGGGGGAQNAGGGGDGLAIVAYVAVGAPTIAAGPPTYVGSGTNVSSLGNLDKHASTAVGDLLIVHAVGSAAGAIPTGGNFRLLHSGRYVDGMSSIWYKIIDGSEPATWVPNTIGMTGQSAYRSHTFRGVNARHILDAFPIGGPQTSPGITTLHANSLVLIFNSMLSFAGGTLAGVDNGFTAGVFSTNVGNVSYGFAYKLIASAGATGAVAFPSTHGSSGTLAVALRSN